jgi:hypothetical protein
MRLRETVVAVVWRAMKPGGLSAEKDCLGIMDASSQTMPEIEKYDV